MPSARDPTTVLDETSFYLRPSTITPPQEDQSMPRHLVPSEHGLADIPLGQVEGKPLQSLQFYQTEDALNLDLQFQGGISLELIFRVGFHASARLLEFRNGNSRILKALKPKRQE
jgi:hypothetical protein